MATEEAQKLAQLRKGSVGAIEIDDHGRRRTIDVADLNEADLALAQQFGYHPVSNSASSSFLPSPRAWAQGK